MTTRLDDVRTVSTVSGVLVALGLVGAFATSSATARGLLVGAALGLVNLVLGVFFTRRSLAGEPGAVLVNIAAGFGARFIVLIGLLTVFSFVPALGVSPAAFGFTFVAGIFLYFGIEAAVALRFQRREAA